MKKIAIALAAVAALSVGIAAHASAGEVAPHGGFGGTTECWIEQDANDVWVIKCKWYDFQ